jgi:hypothetical protein
MEVTRPIFISRMAGVDQDLDSESSLWSLFLEKRVEESSNTSTNRTVSSSFNTGTSSNTGTNPTIGQFFESASAFVTRSGYIGVRQGLGFYGQKQGDATLSSITISIEKHGAFYHPARVIVALSSGATFPLVLNTAVSMHGIRVMDNEVAALTRLAGEFPEVDLPRVFSAGRVQSDSGELSFFLAQWFDGYLEFHLPGGALSDEAMHDKPGHDKFGDGNSEDNKKGQHLLLWENDGSVVSLNPPAYFDIYGQAAEILTRLYNPETFEQVFPWHHAAGDFVVKPIGKGFDVRLITVRNYGSMFGARDEEAELEVEEIYRALLFFFVNMTLRARLDRMDGVGAFCLVDERVISHIVTGFLRGLESKEICGMIGPCLCKSFLDFATEFDSSEFAEILALTLAASNQDAPEMGLLKKNIAAHSTLLASHLGSIGENQEKELFY